MSKLDDLKQLLDIIRKRDVFTFTYENFEELLTYVINTIEQASRAQEPCEWCKGKIGRDYIVKPCANGEHGVKCCKHNNEMVIFEYGLALGYFDMKFCPNCGRALGGE